MPLVSRQALQRLPLYMHYLHALPAGTVHISSASIAENLGLHPVQVRKDLAAVSAGGRPRTGYVTAQLIQDIHRCLGHQQASRAVLAGMGNLGQALFCCGAFRDWGLEIAAAFDCDAALVGTCCEGKEILHIDRIGAFCRQHGVEIGIITVPAAQAQQVCDLMTSHGVLAIWNFAPVPLQVSKGVLVQDENMAASLAALSRHLTGKLQGMCKQA